MSFVWSAPRLCALGLLAASGVITGCYGSLKASEASAPLTFKPALRLPESGRAMRLRLSGRALLTEGAFQIIAGDDPVRVDVARGTTAAFVVSVALAPVVNEAGASMHQPEPLAFDVLFSPSIRVTTVSMNTGLVSPGWVSVRQVKELSFPAGHPASTVARLLSLTLAHLVVGTDGEMLTQDRRFLQKVAVTAAEMDPYEPSGAPANGAEPSQVAIQLFWPGGSAR